MDKIKVGVIQLSIGENIEKNKEKLAAAIRKTAQQGAQLVVLQDEQLQLFYQEKQEMMRAIQNSLQQDGRAREKHSSEITETLQSSLKSMEAVTSALDSRIRKLLVTTSVASVLLSVLVCVVWHLLVG